MAQPAMRSPQNCPHEVLAKRLTQDRILQPVREARFGFPLLAAMDDMPGISVGAHCGDPSVEEGSVPALRRTQRGHRGRLRKREVSREIDGGPQRHAYKGALGGRRNTRSARQTDGDTPARLGDGPPDVHWGKGRVHDAHAVAKTLTNSARRIDVQRGPQPHRVGLRTDDGDVPHARGRRPGKDGRNLALAELSSPTGCPCPGVRPLGAGKGIQTSAQATKRAGSHRALESIRADSPRLGLGSGECVLGEDAAKE